MHKSDLKGNWHIIYLKHQDTYLNMEDKDGMISYYIEMAKENKPELSSQDSLLIAEAISTLIQIFSPYYIKFNDNSTYEHTKIKDRYLTDEAETGFYQLKKRGKILELKEDKSNVAQNVKVSLKDNVLTLEFELNKENGNALIWKFRKEKSSGN